MANKSIKELPTATQIQEDDALPMQQGPTTKQVTGRTLTLWLLGMADGHGGVTDFQKLSESGLEKTYQFTMADTTKYTFTVTDGNGVADFQQSVSGLVHTYKLIMDNGQEYTMTIKDGEKGDKGDNAYLWYKFASEKPTSSSSSMGDEPDAWMGVHSSHEATAPTDPMEYTWVRVLGNTGPTGAPATLLRAVVEYQVGTSGTVVPSGNWSESIPAVPQGNYLWTRTTIQFNTGGIIQILTKTRDGLDGLGSVVSVNNISPGENGNVELTADDVGAVPKSGGTMDGPLHMNGQVLDGLNDPKQDDEAARKAYVDKSVKAAAPVNLLDNSDFRNPVNQRGKSNYTGTEYTIDRWRTWAAGNIVVGDGYVGVSGAALYQYFNIKDLTKPYTAMVMLQDGTKYVYSGTFEDGFGYWDQTLWCGSEQEGSGYFRIESAINSNILYVALYEGTYTDNTLPEYRPKGYAAELAECQRYYRDVRLRGATGFLLDNNRAVFNLDFIKMRIANPTVQVIEGDNLVTPEGYFPVLSDGASFVDNCSVVLPVDNTFNFPAYKPVGAFNCHISVSADL